MYAESVQSTIDAKAGPEVSPQVASSVLEVVSSHMLESRHARQSRYIAGTLGFFQLLQQLSIRPEASKLQAKIYLRILIDSAGLPQVRSSLLEEGAEVQPEEEGQPEAKQHGGTRNILLQPPVFLLFDDPAVGQTFAKERRVVAGRLARIRYGSARIF